MNLQHSLSTSALARLLRAVPRLNRSTPSPEDLAFDVAVVEYTRQNYRAAFKDLAALADNGHVAAARMALLMATHGTRLYGHRFEASAASRRRWRELSAPSQQA